MSSNIVHVTPWPVKPFRPAYPGRMLPLPRNCILVCAYAVDVGIDVIEEVLYYECHGTIRRPHGRLFLISALGLPRELSNSQNVIIGLRKTRIIQVGEVVKIKDCGDDRISVERMFKLLLKKRKKI